MFSNTWHCTLSLQGAYPRCSVSLTSTPLWGSLSSMNCFAPCQTENKQWYTITQSISTWRPGTRRTWPPHTHCQVLSPETKATCPAASSCSSEGAGPASVTYDPFNTTLQRLMLQLHGCQRAQDSQNGLLLILAWKHYRTTDFKKIDFCAGGTCRKG